MQISDVVRSRVWEMLKKDVYYTSGVVRYRCATPPLSANTVHLVGYREADCSAIHDRYSVQQLSSSLSEVTNRRSPCLTHVFMQIGFNLAILSKHVFFKFKLFLRLMTGPCNRFRD